MKFKTYISTLLLATACSLPAGAMDVSIAPKNLSNQGKYERLKDFRGFCKRANIVCDEAEISEGQLDLTSKLLKVNLPKDFWTSLSNLTWLTTLRLEHNNLRILPKEISALSNLTNLYLEGNQLETLPPEIGKLSKLIWLDLSNNQLETLPPEIGNLVNLESLYLYNNKLRTVPPEIGKLANLDMLQLYNNQLETLPPEIGKLSKLSELNLTYNPRLVLPSQISSLSNLTNFYLDDKKLPTDMQIAMPELEKRAHLKNFMAFCKKENIQCDEEEITEGKLDLTSKLLKVNLPKDFWTSLSKLTWLTTLRLEHNNLRILPKEIGALSNLTNLYLEGNQLETLPPEIGKLSKLIWLDLSNNHLKTLPSQIGDLVNLESFYLYNNKLRAVPPEIGKLAHLDMLQLNNNQLQAVPLEIGNLINLTHLHFADNPLRTLPSTIINLKNILVLELLSCPLLLPQGDSQTNWGHKELVAHFHYRVSLDALKSTFMPADTTKAQVYASLDAQPLHINRTWLQKAILPTINAPLLSGDETVALFDNIMSQLNTKDEKQPGYISYEMLMNDYATDKTVLSNGDKILQHFIPRLHGFLKTLYGLPLARDDVKGWQIDSAHVPQMKQALSFILTTIKDSQDIDVRVALMTQLANALLHCPTGQSEGLNTIVYSLQDGLDGIEDLSQHILRTVAIKKNSAFQSAIISKTAYNGQNVHWISFYRDKLKDTLGLTSALSGYKDHLGVFGQDPFSDNPNNVLLVFYEHVTPARVVDWIMSTVKTSADLKVEKHRQELQKLTNVPPPNAMVLTLTKNIENIKKKKQCLEDPKKILIDLKEELKDVPVRERKKWRTDKIAEFESKITNLTRTIARMQGPIATRAPSSALVEYLKSQNLPLADLKAALTAVKSEVKSNAQFRPLSTADISTYLISNKLVNADDNPNWWHGYFTADPEDKEAIAIPTPKVIETILIYMGVLKLKGK